MRTGRLAMGMSASIMSWGRPAPTSRFACRPCWCPAPGEGESRPKYSLHEEMLGAHHIGIAILGEMRRPARRSACSTSPMADGYPAEGCSSGKRPKRPAVTEERVGGLRLEELRSVSRRCHGASAPHCPASKRVPVLQNVRHCSRKSSALAVVESEAGDIESLRKQHAVESNPDMIAAPQKNDSVSMPLPSGYGARGPLPTARSTTQIVPSSLVCDQDRSAV